MHSEKNTEFEINKVLLQFSSMDEFISKIKKEPEYLEYFQHIFADFDSDKQELIRLLNYVKKLATDHPIAYDNIALFCEQFHTKSQNIILNTFLSLDKWLDSTSRQNNLDDFSAFKNHLFLLCLQDKTQDNVFATTYQQLIQNKLAPLKFKEILQGNLERAIEINISLFRVCIKLYQGLKSQFTLEQHKLNSIKEKNLADTVDHITSLVDEIKLNICQFVQPKDMLGLSNTNKHWNSFGKEHTFWSQLLTTAEKSNVDKKEFKEVFMRKQFLKDIEKVLAIRYIAFNNGNGTLIPGTENFHPDIASIERDKKLKLDEVFVKVKNVGPKIFKVSTIKEFAVTQCFVIGYNDADIYDEQLDQLKIFFLESLLKLDVNLIPNTLINIRNDLRNLAKDIGKSWYKLNPNCLCIPQLIEIYATLVKQACDNHNMTLLSQIQYAELDHLGLIGKMPDKEKLIKTESKSRKEFRSALFQLLQSGESDSINFVLKNQSIMSLRRLSESFDNYAQNDIVLEIKKRIDSYISKTIESHYISFEEDAITKKP